MDNSRARQGTSLLTFAGEGDSYSKAVPLPPRRDASALKSHRQRRPAAHSPPPSQPLLNSSTLDDLFRALTLECEQHLAASKRAKDTRKATAVESDDDDYENLHRSTALKTTIEVISPIRRHVVSISVSSKVSKPPPAVGILPAVETKVSRSSADEEQTQNNNNNTRRRRRRTRKRMVSSNTTRSSSSSSGERVEKKALPSKRSCSTDHHSFSSHKGARRAPRRDVSLQHPSPLSVLLTSSSSSNSKSTSDFLTNCHDHRARRSRYESVMHKPFSLLDRMHQQFYRLSPTPRMSSYRVH